MDTIDEVVAAALEEYRGRDVSVDLLDDDGEPQLSLAGRLTGASPVDEDGEVIALTFEQPGGGLHVGMLTLSGDVSAARADVAMRVSGNGETQPVPGLVIRIGDREVQLCRL